MSRCARCGKKTCVEEPPRKTPPGCPMGAAEAVYEEALKEYDKEDVLKIALHAARVEGIGFCEWTRLEEIIEFAWRCAFKKLGLAFCYGLRNEAMKVDKILSDAGFAVASVICKTGGVPKEFLGIAEAEKVHPGRFDAMCNPVVQAKLLAREKTQLNIMLGLCVGHDTIFCRYSEAPVTVLAVKDRVLAHNPLGVVNAPVYFKERLARHINPWRKP